MNRNRVFVLMFICLTILTILTVSTSDLRGIIENPDKPLKGNWDFQIQKKWEVESAGENVIAELQNIVVSKDGRIYVADSQNCLNYIFSKDGKFIASFGNKGEGPGEILSYGSGIQLFIAGDTLLYFDVHRIHYFSLDGKYKKTVIVPRDLLPAEFVSEDVFFSVPYTLDDPAQKEAEVILYNIKDKSRKVIAKFFPFANAKKSQRIQGRQRVTVVIEAPNLIPKMLLTLRNGKILYGMNDSYRINLLDLKENKNIGFGIGERKVADFPEQLKKQVPQILKSMPPDMLKKIIDGLPEKITYFQQLNLDKNGLVYVFVSAPLESNEQAVDIFSTAGEYRYSSKLVIPEGLAIKPDFIYFKDELLILAAEDEDGNIKIMKFTVKLPVL